MTETCSHLYSLRASCSLELEGDDLLLAEGADWKDDIARLMEWIEHDRGGRIRQPSMRLSCEWFAGRIESVSITMFASTSGADTVDFLLTELPAYGPEIVWAMSRGCRTCHFDRSLESDASFAFLAASGDLSAHERLAIRGRAIALLDTMGGDSYTLDLAAIIAGED